MAENEEDMLLVNPGGRVVEVPHELGLELLAQPTEQNSKPFRAASDKEVKEYKDSQKGIAPAVLAKREEKRLADEKKSAEDYFKGENGEPTGAQPAAQSAQDNTTAEPSGSAEADQRRNPDEGKVPPEEPGKPLDEVVGADQVGNNDKPKSRKAPSVPDNVKSPTDEKPDHPPTDGK